MGTKFIVIAIVAFFVSARVFKHTRAAQAILGYMGVYALLLIMVNTFLSKF